MILVKAEDSFLYQSKFVNTGNKVLVEEKDIPKLIAAGKISPSYMPDITEEQAKQRQESPEQTPPDKFLKQERKSKSRKNKKYY